MLLLSSKVVCMLHIPHTHVVPSPIDKCLYIARERNASLPSMAVLLLVAVVYIRVSTTTGCPKASSAQ